MKKSVESQMEMINSFRKNWESSYNYRLMQKKKEITANNKFLHQSLSRQYNRQSLKT